MEIKKLLTEKKTNKLCELLYCLRLFYAWKSPTIGKRWNSEDIAFRDQLTTLKLQYNFMCLCRSTDREFLDRDARRVRELGIATFAVGVQGAFVPELRVSNSVANWLNEWLPPLKQKALAHFWAVQIDHQMDHTALFFSTGPIASSFLAETFAQKQGLNWCTNYLMTSKFQSVLFLTDSQLALSILSSAPSYLLPEFLLSVWSLASSLSNNTTISFQWVPGHAGLPGNENANFLAKSGASLSTGAISCLLPTVIAKILYHSYLNDQVPVPKVSSEELLLSRPIRCELSRLRCHGYSLLLSSYLHRISRKENSACSACGHPLQDFNHLLDCPPLNRFVNLSLAPLSLYSWPMVQTFGCGPTLGLAEFFRAPIPRKGSSSTTAILRG